MSGDAALPVGLDVPPAEPLDAQIQTLIDNLPGGLALPVGRDAVKARNQFRRITVALRDQQPPADLASVEDIAVPGAVGKLAARVYRPHADQPTAAILFFHGGGFIVGDVESYDLQARSIAERTGMTLISAEYRLAPEDPFPAAPDDAESIAHWAVANANKFGDGRVIVMGDSAGGSLSAVVAQRVDGIAGQVLIYPTTDFSRPYDSFEQHAAGPVLTGEAGIVFGAAYLGDAAPTDPRVSPMLGELDPTSPPAVVVTCEYDILRDPGLAYAAKLEAAGVQTKRLHYASLMHGFVGFFPLSIACNAALDDICAATVELVG